MILSLDPGQQGLSWMLAGATGNLISGAVIPLKGRDLWAQAMHAITQMPRPDQVRHVACERMWFYPQRSSAKMSAEVRAILDLQAIGGLVSGYYRCPVSYYRPSEWMGGSLPNHVVKGRVEMFLSLEEMEVFSEILGATPKELRHNAYDAAGILLRHLGRWR